jgi:hypothetical protein
MDFRVHMVDSLESICNCSKTDASASEYFMYLKLYMICKLQRILVTLNRKTT